MCSPLLVFVLRRHLCLWNTVRKKTTSLTVYKLQFHIYVYVGIDGIIVEEGSKCREEGRDKFQTHFIKYIIPTDDLFNFFLFKSFENDTFIPIASSISSKNFDPPFSQRILRPIDLSIPSPMILPGGWSRGGPESRCVLEWQLDGR